MRLLPPFSGAVLAGGGSRRFGRDKALAPHPHDGRALAAHVADALRNGGAAEVLAIGGDADGLAALGLDARPDDHPGEGPLGGVATALALAAFDEVVVLACDLPAVDAGAVRSLVATLRSHPSADVAVARVDGVPQVAAAAWRRRAGAALAEAFAGGERSLQAGLARLVVATVDDVDPSRWVDVDTPDDVDRYARGHPGGG